LKIIQNEGIGSYDGGRDFLEGFNLRLALLSLGRFEKEIVVALGIERRAFAALK
jgi:hypothetical protein